MELATTKLEEFKMQRQASVVVIPMAAAQLQQRSKIVDKLLLNQVRKTGKCSLLGMWILTLLNQSNNYRKKYGIS